MPQLIRFLVSQFCDGAVIGLGLAQALLYFDVAGLGHMLGGSADSLAFTAIYFLKAALLFGTLWVSLALGRPPDQDR